MAARVASTRSVAAASAATPALTTPTARCWRQSLQRLALVVAAIRVAYLAVSLLLARLLPDYDTSAELVSADCAADWPVKAAARAREQAAAVTASPSSSLLPPPSPSSWGLVWDAVFYHRIAACGYEYEQFAAFFPGFPAVAGRLASAASGWWGWCGSGGRAGWAPPPASLGPRAFAAAGLVINNLAFVAAAVLLAHLGRAVLGGLAEQEGEEDDDNNRAPTTPVERASLAAALLFGLQPASIFTAIPYTESLFAMLTFAGLCCLYCPSRGRRAAATSSSSSSKRSRASKAAAAAPANRLAHALRFEAAALFFCLAACLRSNGAVNAAFLLHAGAAAALAELLPTVGPRKRRRQSGALSAAAASAAALLIALRAAVCAAAVLAPSLLFQRHIAAIFCDGAPVQAMAGGGGGRGGAAAPSAAAAAVATRQPTPDWCGSGLASSHLFHIRSSYAHVQARYWGVGPLAYWRARQLPNFALALPALALAAGGALGVYLCARPATLLLAGGVLPSAAWEARVVSWVEAWLGSRRRGAGGKGGAGNKGGRRRDAGGAVASSPRSSSFFSSSRRAAVFAVQMLALALFAALTMNVQVATRMLCSSCPALYWSAAEMAGLGDGSDDEEEDDDGRASGAPQRRSRNTAAAAAAALWAYCAGFALAGAVMSLQALPWT